MALSGGSYSLGARTDPSLDSIGFSVHLYAIQPQPGAEFIRLSSVAGVRADYRQRA